MPQWRGRKKNTSMGRLVTDAWEKQKHSGLKQNIVVIEGFHCGFLFVVLYNFFIKRQPSSQPIFKECFA